MARKTHLDYINEELNVINTRLKAYTEYGYSVELDPLVNILVDCMDKLNKLLDARIFEQKVRRMYDSYLAENNDEKPDYLHCAIRWKEDGDVQEDNIGISKHAEDEHCVFRVSGILMLLDLIRYNEEDFEIIEAIAFTKK